VEKTARRPLYFGTCYSNCESHQDYKGNLSTDRCFQRENFREKEAQKTNAFQKQQHLIGDKATINAKTIRDFFADDVKCSHGCTMDN
jgi:Fe-S cluster assembly protein SufD